MEPASCQTELRNTLRLQITAATYDAHVAGLRLIEAGPERWLLATPSAQSLEWLQSPRLYPLIEAAAQRLAGEPVTVEIELAQNGNGHDLAAPEPDPMPDDSPGAAVARADYYSAYFGGKGKPAAAGYAMLPHYASQFWVPFLGRAFLLWKRLDADSRVDLKQVENRWSDVRVITYRSLANKLNYPHTRYIAGQTLECSASGRAIAEAGEPIAQCCLNHAPIRTKIDHQDRPRCYYWYTGQLEELYNEKLIGIDVEKKGSSPRSYTIQIQVWRLLPILTPHQVGQLNGDLQQDHQR